MDIRARSAEASHGLRDLVVGVLILVVFGAIGVFANIPTRTSVLESRVDSIEKNMDVKLDAILQRLPR